MHNRCSNHWAVTPVHAHLCLPQLPSSFSNSLSAKPLQSNHQPRTNLDSHAYERRFTLKHINKERLSLALNTMAQRVMNSNSPALDKILYQKRGQVFLTPESEPISLPCIGEDRFILNFTFYTLIGRHGSIRSRSEFYIQSLQAVQEVKYHALLYLKHELTVWRPSAEGREDA